MMKNIPVKSKGKGVGCLSAVGAIERGCAMLKETHIITYFTTGYCCGHMEDNVSQYDCEQCVVIMLWGGGKL